MTFSLLCIALIALLFGLAVVFCGYRVFPGLLPIWGFFFGFFLGIQSVQALFGIGFLATVTSWVVGFFVGALFAVLSYLFYIFAVAILSGSFGYGLTVGILTWIGLDYGFLVWIIGIVVGIARHRDTRTIGRPFRPDGVPVSIENHLFYADNTQMLYGDGQKAVSELIAGIKTL